jgi:hypothetical protein
VNPTDHVVCCRHEDHVFFQLKKAREALRHDVRCDWISELPAQARNRWRVV